MALPAGVDGVTVSSGKPLTLPDGTPFEGKLLFTGPDVVTVAGQDVLLGGTREAKLVDGAFSITLAANDVVGMSPSGWTYTVTAVLSNAPSWVRHISLPKASPTVILADVIVPDPVVGSYATLVDASSVGAGSLAKSQNLADLEDKPAARTNLGLGTAAVAAASSFDGAGAASDALAAAISDAAGKYRRLQPWVFDVTDYTTGHDSKVVIDGAMLAGSAVLTSASGQFETDIVNKTVIVNGAGASGVTSLVAVVQSRQSASQVTLSLANASGGNLTAAKVVWGTNDGTALQAATDAAMSYLNAGNPLAAVWFPPGGYMNAAPLNSSHSGNGQIAFGSVATSGQKKTLMFLGPTDGAAAVRHWQQGEPQFSGACIISAGVYSSTSAQTADINAHGNPAVICGPNEASGYGVGANFSNMQVVVKNLSILTTHSSFGLTYGALNLWGVANAYVENVGFGTLGTVASPSADYNSPGVFGTGLSIGMALPAPGNNDHVIARNISCGGGYTYAMFLTEHAVMDRYMALYCWAGLVAVGTYASSVGSVHAMKVLSASIEACVNELYIYGAGSSGIGPIIDIDQLSTENSTPNVAGSSTAAMNSALGRVRLTGLFTESGVSVSAPTGIELVNGQVPRAIKRKTGAFTCSPIDRTLVCDTTSAGFTGTLPDASFCPTEYVFKNVGSNTLTIGTTSSQLIYTSSGTGATTATVTTGQTLRVQALYNGTSWGWYAV
ncbi:hypothetical protein [Streptomyces sp. NPDC050534]|uniref:hypothetical protein n=1 Tax=Streptomyces sp. NPDC050534 TaxID=3365625 RepID=UPI0037877261